MCEKNIAKHAYLSLLRNRFFFRSFWTDRSGKVVLDGSFWTGRSGRSHCFLEGSGPLGRVLFRSSSIITITPITTMGILSQVPDSFLDAFYEGPSRVLRSPWSSATHDDSRTTFQQELGYTPSSSSTVASRTFSPTRRVAPRASAAPCATKARVFSFLDVGPLSTPTAVRRNHDPSPASRVDEEGGLRQRHAHPTRTSFQFIRCGSGYKCVSQPKKFGYQRDKVNLKRIMIPSTDPEEEEEYKDINFDPKNLQKDQAQRPLYEDGCPIEGTKSPGGGCRKFGKRFVLKRTTTCTVCSCCAWEDDHHVAGQQQSVGRWSS